MSFCLAYFILNLKIEYQFIAKESRVHDLKDGKMLHGRDGARVHVLCLGCLSWSGHSSRVYTLEERDGAFKAGMVTGGIQWWGTWVSDIH